MPIYNYKNHHISYRYDGEKGTPVIAFINGLTQRTLHWQPYAEYLTKRGLSVLTYDLLGQGESSKPVLSVDFDDNVNVLFALMAHLKIEKVHVAGISFGGIIVLKFAIKFPDRTASIVPMSTFSEMDSQLEWFGMNLYQGMVTVGFEYLVDMLIPINFSPNHIAKFKEQLPTIRRAVATYNDLYAIQNIIESLQNFKPFTHELAHVKCPALIMNAEYDCLTTRRLHEILRKNLINSRLMLMQHTCHAFTLEIPEITCRIIDDFVKSVESGKWKGDQSVWIATDDYHSKEMAYPCKGDHTRAIPVPDKEDKNIQINI
ncbi:MAG: alpha/beta hydrolase superfamily protein [Candidatus Magnetoglobus multicellularis str. Araruama]|jgi:pimeloyl-ACP methyl ester carboxylesterase|uniref:Alpha/beta hydrolase superfamily protein n=1 Tax=Candidatus Magnetoglobus multicellularis str. Araruama TaxID=890399 RepID=A0A1V1P187_9BACT|nr:MAG: alpha/beta hydrolase superfamily protein [Candidatus Magnetoglobus multicellularis str. Araruama]